VEDKIIEELENARESICFATFTFTSDPIEKALISKLDDGIEIKGIYDERGIGSQYCSYQNLKDEGILVTKDRNQYTMHNKVFIIDGETVITGSFNPTKHANIANDENILIIHDSEVANIYNDEFSSLWNKWY
jgi:phosphatidylserine/phosphatidylglycerophosphate/cardiolipin synthase-like enzyme